MLGANPMGRSLTTGLGKVYPVRLLSHPQWLIEETVPDPIPGLTPYTYAGPGSAAAREMIYLLQYRPRKDFDYPGVQVSLMPHALSDRQDLTPQQARRCWTRIFRCGEISRIWKASTLPPTSSRSGKPSAPPPPASGS